jgi:GH24 family phage-related lysozyme (muramidase)
MKTSQRGIDILKDLEAFSAEPYPDEGGDATIGYGHWMHKGPPTEDEKLIRWTVEQAEADLVEQLKKYEQELNDKIVPVMMERLKQSQFDALVLWTYNCGIGALQRCSWLKSLNRGMFLDVPRLMSLYNKVEIKGMIVVSPGLVTRRGKETVLFLE